MRLTLLSLSAVSITSFILWPASDNAWFQTLFWTCCLLTTGIVVSLLRQLWHWQVQLTISLVSDVQHIQVNQSCLVQCKPPWVSPFMAVIWLCDPNNAKNKRMLMVFADMLTDSQYHHLCRTLLQAR